jgi:Ca2+-binding EF-hand superfamily protein
MTTIGNSNPLSGMLNNAFAKFDKDGDGKLNGDEFKRFNEILNPGIAVDETGAPTVDYRERMDHNADGAISQEEMSTTGVLMPATLTDPSLKSMLYYLSLQTDPSAVEAAAILREAESDAV